MEDKPQKSLHDLHKSREMLRNQWYLGDKINTIKDLILRGPVGVINVQLDGKIIYCNPAFLKAIGYSYDEIKDLDFMSLVHPDDRARTEAVFAEALEKVAELNFDEIVVQHFHRSNFQNRYVSKTGKIISILWNSCFLKDEETGELFVGAFAVFLDGLFL